MFDKYKFESMGKYLSFILIILPIVIMSCNNISVSHSMTQEEIFRFDSLFTAWEYNYRTNLHTRISSSTHSAKTLNEYPELLDMGEKIIPLIIEKLKIEDNFFALTLYDELQQDSSLKSILGGEQDRARETVLKYQNYNKSSKSKIYN